MNFFLRTRRRTRTRSSALFTPIRATLAGRVEFTTPEETAGGYHGNHLCGVQCTCVTPHAVRVRARANSSIKSEKAITPRGRRPSPAPGVCTMIASINGRMTTMTITITTSRRRRRLRDVSTY